MRPWPVIAFALAVIVFACGFEFGHITNNTNANLHACVNKAIDWENNQYPINGLVVEQFGIMTTACEHIYG